MGANGIYESLDARPHWSSRQSGPIRCGSTHLPGLLACATTSYRQASVTRRDQSTTLVDFLSLIHRLARRSSCPTYVTNHASSPAKRYSSDPQGKWAVWNKTRPSMAGNTGTEYASPNE